MATEPKARTTSSNHPARYSKELLPVFLEMLPLKRWSLVLDPMAGTGERLDQLAELRPDLAFRGLELEECWIKSERVCQGDARRMSYPIGTVDAIITSPTYGNGMNDYFKSAPSDTSARNTYIHRARAATDNPDLEFSVHNTARYHFGSEQYNRIHLEIYAECARVLAKGGRFILNTKNSTGKPRGVKADYTRITEWHVAALELMGLTVVDRRQVNTPGMKLGANRDRFDYEDVTLLRKIQ